MPIHYLILPFLAAFATTLWIYPKILRIALDKNIVDNPEARKLQKTPVPILGGVAVFFGLAIGLFCSQLMVVCTPLFPILVALIIMLFIGTMDDIIGLSARFRLFVEIAIVLFLILITGFSLDSFHGLWGVETLPQWLAILLTIVTVVGIINAINMIDGVDGLSSGFCIMASLLFGVIFYYVGYIPMTLLAVISIGVLLPFFVHNVFGNKSKMFIGDGGTLVMGLIISAFVINMLREGSPCVAVDKGLGLIPFSLAVLSIPVFDTLRVMGTRILRCVSPFHPDKTHLHHLFIDLEFSHIGTTIAILFLNAFAVLCWWLSYKMGASIDMQLYVVVAFGLLSTFGLYPFMKYHQCRNTRFLHFIQCIGRASHVDRFGFFLWMQNRVDRIITHDKEAKK